MLPASILGWDITHNGQKWHVICREFGPYQEFGQADSAADDANRRMKKSRELSSSLVVKGRPGIKSNQGEQ